MAIPIGVRKNETTPTDTERAQVKSLYKRPLHPYTRGLLSTLPRLDGERSERLLSIKGQPPNLMAPPGSCPFAPRCPHVFERCERENPGLLEAAPGHEVACWWDAPERRPETPPEGPDA